MHAIRMFERLVFLGCALCLLAAGAAAQDANTKWMRLWNGKDLTGWKFLPQYFKVDSGMIVATGHLTGYNTFCHTQQTFSDFELSVRARLYEVNPWYTNSGIQYRSRVADSARRILQGPQLDIGDGASASMYPEGGYGGPGAGSSSACRSAMRKSDWNHYIINANGSKVGHKLNLATCNDFTNSVTQGTIGLQMHFLVGSFTATSTTTVNFKDIYIRPLNNSFVIPDSLAVFLKADYTATSESSGLAGHSGSKAAREPILRPFLGGGRFSLPGASDGARITAFDLVGRMQATRNHRATLMGVSIVRVSAGNPEAAGNPAAAGDLEAAGAIGSDERTGR